MDEPSEGDDNDDDDNHPEEAVFEEARRRSLLEIYIPEGESSKAQVAKVPAEPTTIEIQEEVTEEEMVDYEFSHEPEIVVGIPCDPELDEVRDNVDEAEADDEATLLSIQEDTMVIINENFPSVFSE